MTQVDEIFEKIAARNEAAGWKPIKDANGQTDHRGRSWHFIVSGCPCMACFTMAIDMVAAGEESEQ